MLNYAAGILVPRCSAGWRQQSLQAKPPPRSRPSQPLTTQRRQQQRPYKLRPAPPVLDLPTQGRRLGSMEDLACLRAGPMFPRPSLRRPQVLTPPYGLHQSSPTSLEEGIRPRHPRHAPQRPLLAVHLNLQPLALILSQQRLQLQVLLRLPFPLQEQEAAEEVPQIQEGHGRQLGSCHSRASPRCSWSR